MLPDLPSRAARSPIVTITRWIMGIAAACLLGNPGPSHAAEGKLSVDLALVLAVDVSLSIDDGELGLQRRGYVHALRDQRVIDAIQSGSVGRIAVTYVEWSSPYHQTILVPWRVIHDAATAKALADELERAPAKMGSTTSISGAIDFGVKLLKKSGYDAARSVLDISGDGYSDYGRPVKAARDEAVKTGITINGLAVINQDPKKNAAPADLDKYFRENVIGGPGSFVLVARNMAGFSESVLHKLVLEIAQNRVALPPRG